MKNKYEYWLSALPILSGRKKVRMRSLHQEAEELYRMKPEELQAQLGLTEKEKEALALGQKTPESELEENMEFCIQNGIGLVSYWEKEYPKGLKNIYNPPYGLYFKGAFPKASDPAIAVVGARNCSVWGQKTAEQIGFRLAECGVSVISGMAQGIDGAGHLGALQALSKTEAAAGRRNTEPLGRFQEAGKTYGVLGCGIDVCYPASHRRLYEQLVRQGGVISEYPPSTRPRAMLFPQRNRIISGLSDGVIVVEAREKSGALITADFALEQGKEVYAVPGRITDGLSQGTNRLIRQGAGIFLSVEDFLKEMKLFTDFMKSSVKNTKLSLEKSERLVYSCLDLSPKNLDRLLTETMLSIPELMENLESLRKKGCILEVYHNYYIRSEVSDFA